MGRKYIRMGTCSGLNLMGNVVNNGLCLLKLLQNMIGTIFWETRD